MNALNYFVVVILLVCNALANIKTIAHDETPKKLERIHNEILPLRIRLILVRNQLKERPKQKLPLEGIENEFLSAEQDLSYLQGLVATNDDTKAIEKTSEIKELFDGVLKQHRDLISPRIADAIHKAQIGLKDKNKIELRALEETLIRLLNKKRAQKKVLAMTNNNALVVEQRAVGHKVLSKLERLKNALLGLLKSVQNDKVKRVVESANSKIMGILKAYKAYGEQEATEETKQQPLKQVEITGVKSSATKVIAHIDSEEETKIASELKSLEAKSVDLEKKMHANWAKHGLWYIPKKSEITLAHVRDLETIVKRLYSDHKAESNALHISNAHKLLQEAIGKFSLAIQSSGQLPAVSLVAPQGEKLKELVKEGSVITKEYAATKAKIKKLQERLQIMEKQTHHENPDKVLFKEVFTMLKNAAREIGLYKKSLGSSSTIKKQVEEIENNIRAALAEEMAEERNIKVQAPHIIASLGKIKKSNVPIKKVVRKKDKKPRMPNPKVEVVGKKKIASKSEKSTSGTSTEAASISVFTRPKTESAKKPAAGKRTLGFGEEKKVVDVMHEIDQIKKKLRQIQARLDKAWIATGHLPEVKRIEIALKVGKQAEMKLQNLLPVSSKTNRNQLMRYKMQLKEALKLLLGYRDKVLAKEALLPKLATEELVEHVEKIDILMKQKQEALSKLHSLQGRLIEIDVKVEGTTPKNASEAVATIHLISKYLEGLAWFTGNASERKELAEIVMLVNDVSRDLEFCDSKEKVGMAQTMTALKGAIAKDKAEMEQLNQGKELSTFREQEKIIQVAINALDVINKSIKRKQSLGEPASANVIGARDNIAKTIDKLKTLIVPPAQLGIDHKINRSVAAIEEDLAEKRQELQVALVNRLNHKAASTQVKDILASIEEAHNGLARAESKESNPDVKNEEKISKELTEKLKKYIARLTFNRVEDHVSESHSPITSITGPAEDALNMKSQLDEAERKLAQLTSACRTKKREFCKNAPLGHVGCTQSKSELATSTEKMIASIQKYIHDNPNDSINSKRQDIISNLRLLADEARKENSPTKVEGAIPHEKSVKFTTEMHRIEEDIKEQRNLVKKLRHKLGLPVQGHKKMEGLKQLIDQAKIVFADVPLASNLSQALTALAMHGEPVPHHKDKKHSNVAVQKNPLAPKPEDKRKHLIKAA